MNNNSILNMAAGCLLGILVAGQSGFKNDVEQIQNGQTTYIPVPHPDSLSFAGEPVPLDESLVQRKVADG